MAPLNGLRVIEFESIGPAPFCGMHFADLGAEVILIERKKLPVGHQDANILRRGKYSITLELKDDSDLDIALRLIDSADALIEGMRPGVMERLGLGPDVCLKTNPKLVYGRVTGWGQTGPLSHAAGHDLNYLGLSGAAWYSSPAGQPPVPPPTLIGDVGGGAHYLMIGVLAAIINAKETGKGDVVDAAMVDGSAHMMNLLLSLKPSGLLQDERGNSILDGPPWYDAYECADGKYINLGSLEEKFYKELLRAIGLEDDERFFDQYDTQQWHLQKGLLKKLFRTKTRHEWCSRLEGTDTCFAPILNPTESAQHPHMKQRDVYYNSPEGQQARAAPVFKSSGFRQPNIIPERGQHTDEIIKMLKE